MKGLLSEAFHICLNIGEGSRDMRHIQRVTVTKAMADNMEKQDGVGAIFLQVWLTVLSVILSKGFDN